MCLQLTSRGTTRKLQAMTRSGNPAFPGRAVRAAGVIISVCLYLGSQSGCEDDPPPPPPPTQPEPAAPPIDLRHKLQFKADRTVVIPNLVLVLQADTVGVAVSLTTSRPTYDGTSVIFGEYARDARLEKLVGTEIHMRSGRIFTVAGSMVRTTTAVYKPREAVLQITSVKDDEATGTIKGAFHRFAAPQTAMTPPTDVNVDATFLARLIIR